MPAKVTKEGEGKSQEKVGIVKKGIITKCKKDENGLIKKKRHEQWENIRKKGRVENQCGQRKRRIEKNLEGERKKEREKQRHREDYYRK